MQHTVQIKPTPDKLRPPRVRHFLWFWMIPSSRLVGMCSEESVMSSWVYNGSLLIAQMSAFIYVRIFQDFWRRWVHGFTKMIEAIFHKVDHYAVARSVLLHIQHSMHRTAECSQSSFKSCHQFMDHDNLWLAWHIKVQLLCASALDPGSSSDWLFLWLRLRSVDILFFLWVCRPDKDIRQKQWKTCALVGRSPIIKLSKSGHGIDQHDAVWRFNLDTPQSSQGWVGTNTNVRVLSHLDASKSAGLEHKRNASEWHKGEHEVRFGIHRVGNVFHVYVTLLFKHFHFSKMVLHLHLGFA